MPIKVENLGLYPENWAELTAEIKGAVDYFCEECDTQCRRPGEEYDTQKRTMTVAHYENDYTSDAIFLAAMCAPCHLRHDAQFIWSVRRKNEEKGQVEAGQLKLGGVL